MVTFSRILINKIGGAMRKALYLGCFIAGMGVGGLVFYALDKQEKQQVPIIIKVPEQSWRGLPIAIIQMPVNPPSMIRRPLEDKVTPPGTKMAKPAQKIVVAPTINAWNSDFGPKECLYAHRHPVFRLVIPWGDATLLRTHEDGSMDTLTLKPNTILVFAPDPKQYHTDCNMSSASHMRATVIEISPALVSGS